MAHPALALIETSSIARAALVLDALTKRARVQILRSQPVSPGKFITLFAGPEAEVGEAFTRGREIAAELLIDQLHLPDAHASLVSFIEGAEAPLVPDEALLVSEYGTVASALRALDRALKSAAVLCKKLHLARGIGGKAYFVLGGELADVQAAADAARAVADTPQLLHSELIARLSGDVKLEML